MFAYSFWACAALLSAVFGYRKLRAKFGRHRLRNTLVEFNELSDVQVLEPGPVWVTFYDMSGSKMTAPRRLQNVRVALEMVFAE